MPSGNATEAGKYPMPAPTRRAVAWIPKFGAGRSNGVTHSLAPDFEPSEAGEIAPRAKKPSGHAVPTVLNNPHESDYHSRVA